MRIMPRRANADIRSVPQQLPALGSGAIDAETVAALDRRMAAAEQNLDEMRARLHDAEQSVKTLTVAIESARTATAQTDDLLERVAEMLAAQPAEDTAS
jgi:predicted  nucleic acid-binding Zn-ribbon protein